MSKFRSASLTYAIDHFQRRARNAPIQSDEFVRMNAVYKGLVELKEKMEKQHEAIELFKNVVLRNG